MIGVLCSVFLGCAIHVGAQVIERVSVSSTGAEADGPSWVVSGHRVVSADGRYVVFWSEATNLVEDDTNGVQDVFIRDRVSNTTERVSLDVSGGNADGPSRDASISADGRYVSFTSAATDLVENDRNWHWDIFVRDLQMGETMRVSVTPEGADALDDSAGSSISADGRYVAFVTWARLLAPGDTDWGFQRDVIVRDIELGENVVASVTPDGGNPEKACWNAAISGDGRHVVFMSQSTDLIPDETDQNVDIYHYDLDTGQMTRASVGFAGGDADSRSASPEVSRDGRYVVFRSWATDHVEDDTNGQADIFVRDLLTQRTTRVSVSSTGEQAADGGSWHPHISDDGRYVTFLTDASNLFDNDTDALGDIVVHDRVTGQTETVSRGVSGDQPNGWIGNPGISSDGRYVVFESDADNLVEGDTNGLMDVFIANGLATGPHLSIPAVARVQGSGAFFSSRIDAFNASAEELAVEVVFTPRSDVTVESRITTITLSPRQMITVEDPLHEWFGIGSTRAAGSLMFTVTAGPPGALKVQSVVTARNDDGSEYGQFFPAVSDGLKAGDTAYLSTTVDPWRTRVNFGAMALVDGTQISVQPVDPIGNPMSDAQVLSLDAGVSHQLNDVNRPQVFDLGDAGNYLLEVLVSSGSAVVFGSVLDGNASQPGTNDPTTIQPVIGGSSRVTLIELGPVTGYNEFSGSASISNLSDEDVEIQADFYLRDRPGIAQTTVMSRAAGATDGYGDIIGHLVTRSDVGTLVLHAEEDAQILATGREYSISRAADDRVTGTAGQLIPGMTDRDLLRTGAVYHLLGLRHRETDAGLERSHVAAFNPGEDDAQISLDLYDGATGSLEGSMAFMLRGGELRQINNVIEEINRHQNGGEKRLQVTADRSVFVKGFRVNASGDPVTIDLLPE